MIQALLFDIGRVVIDIDFDRVLAAWARASNLPTPPGPVTHDDAYKQHEVGALSAQDYFTHLRHTLQLQCDDAAVRDGWNSVFVRPIPDTVDLIRAARERLPCYAFSNTNATHLAEMWRAFPEVLALFRTVFTSHEIARRKPDTEAFRHVLEAMQLAAPATFSARSSKNSTSGARACGMQAVLVRSPGDVRAALLEHGIVAP